MCNKGPISFITDDELEKRPRNGVPTPELNEMWSNRTFHSLGLWVDNDEKREKAYPGESNTGTQLISSGLGLRATCNKVQVNVYYNQCCHYMTRNGYV